MSLFTAYALIEVETTAEPVGAQRLSDEQAEAFCRAWNRKHAISPLATEEVHDLFSLMNDHGQHWQPAEGASGQIPSLLWLKYKHHCSDGSIFSDGKRKFVLKKIGSCRQIDSDLQPALSAWCNTPVVALPQISL